jgi:hypothetical protein
MCAIFSVLNSEYPSGNLVWCSDVHFKQWAVIEFLVAEKQSVRRIYKRLKNIYGCNAVHRGTVFVTGIHKMHILKRPSRLQ